MRYSQFKSVVEQVQSGKMDRMALVEDIKEGQAFRLNSTDAQVMETGSTKDENITATWRAVPTEITIDGRAVYVPGVDLRDYEKRKTILWNHSDDFQVGRAMWTKYWPNPEDAKEIRIGGEFMPGEDTQRIGQLVKDGWYNMVSPGLWPVESYFFEEAEEKYEEAYGKKPKKPLYYFGYKTILYELSIAPVAAWSGAQRMSLDHIKGFSEKAKNVLTFDLMNDIFERVEALESTYRTLGVPTSKTAGDIQEILGASSSVKSGDVDVQKMFTELNKIQRILHDEKNQAKRRDI